MTADETQVVYLEAFYPRTSQGFLLVSFVLFAGLTGFFALALGTAFLPLTLIFALVALYLASVIIRQARGVTLAIRVTDRSIYYAGWEPRLFQRGLRGGQVPLDAIGSVELVSMRSATGAGPVIALWLADPGLWRRRRVGRWAREMAGTGDLSITCDETDRTAEQVKTAIDIALADLLAGSTPD